MGFRIWRKGALLSSNQAGEASAWQTVEVADAQVRGKKAVKSTNFLWLQAGHCAVNSVYLPAL